MSQAAAPPSPAASTLRIELARKRRRVKVGTALHAGMVVVADGTAAAARRLQRVLTTDPATGILRHADAGYEDALAAARQHGLAIPTRDLA